ncbi:MAG TPA: electron transfer flavoprotein subunit beta/FixA family protein [Thermoanaerobaculia bacterium]|nr:electron transfer flavoprotein subunit beta/FixA family protein [Thermoanaerobaculia bacterium]
MNSIVCIAYVPDTETKIRVAADGKSIDESDVKWIVSPYDEYALEEAIKTKESKGAGAVTVLSLGPERAKTGIRECLARGADDGIWIDSKGDALDALGVARNIAAAVKDLPRDVVWFGQKGVGFDESLVGPMVAELLGVPHVANVVKFEAGDGKVVCEREIEGAHEHVEAPLPCVITAQKGLNEPRYASLKGIMAAKKKPIQERAAETFAPKTTLTRLELPPPPKPCHFIPGGDPKSSAEGAAADPAGAARELARLLREEAKVI